jgi:hypothetical protein
VTKMLVIPALLGMIIFGVLTPQAASADNVHRIVRQTTILVRGPG